MTARVYLGDCLDLLRSLDADSVDAVVCDPPYGLGFMGKAWDALPPGEEWAREVLRVVKPGGHLVAFGGTRTVHRLACALEDAGWEIRDTIGWVYFSGFPKSLDLSKSIDRLHGASPVLVGPHPTNNCPGGPWCECGDRDERAQSGATRHPALTAPATDDARTWDGWGTALKPATEPAILARKPLAESSIARQVLATRTGGLNIDACRFADGDPAWVGPSGSSGWESSRPSATGDFLALEKSTTHDGGPRWPANLYQCPKASRTERERGCDGLPTRTGAQAVERVEGSAGMDNPRAGAGRTASRVLNHHPTVKPVRVMRWLCRLVTPPGGLVLDPFAGSGSCGVAAVLEGFDYLGAELEPEYHRIAEARIAHAQRWPASWADTEPGLIDKPEDADWRERVEKAGQIAMFGGGK